jgi:hypothetical protein
MKIRGNTVGTTTPRANLAQENPKSASYVEGREVYLVGKAGTGNASAVFNDQENEAISDNSTASGYKSISGSKGFKILALEDLNGMDEWMLTLSSVEGIEREMRCSLRMKDAAYDVGTISLEKKNADGTGQVYLCISHPGTDDAFVPEMETDAESEYSRENYLTIVGRPDLGDIDVGFHSHAEGEQTIAQDRASHAEGRETMALGQYGHAEGRETIAAYSSHAEGRLTKALGHYSHAEGRDSVASGYISHAEGSEAQAIGKFSHAEGKETTAEGNCSHTEGFGTKANGESAHAEGDKTLALEKAAHAEGSGTKANGANSHAEGALTISDGTNSHAEGFNTKATSYGAHAEGGATTASGESAHADGAGTTASGNNSHAEGSGAKATGNHSHAENMNTTASGACSHAEGYLTIASAEGAHSEGRENTVSGIYSHAEGYLNKVAAKYSHVQGVANEIRNLDDDNKAVNSADVSGYHNIGNGSHQHVAGKFNNPVSNLARITGGGTSEDDRNNIEELDWDGNLTLGGDVFPKGVRALTEKTGVSMFGDVNDSANLPSQRSGIFRTTDSNWSGVLPAKFSVYAVMRSGAGGNYTMWLGSDGESLYYATTSDNKMPTAADWRSLNAVEERLAALETAMLEIAGVNVDG